VLVISRKKNEVVYVGEQRIPVVVIGMQGNRVKLGFPTDKQGDVPPVARGKEPFSSGHRAA